MKSIFLKLHLSVILAGFTGIFGKLVHLHQLPLAWYRVTLAALLLFVMLTANRRLQKVCSRDFMMIGGVGALLALHWMFFYGSIKESNISIGVVCYSLVGFFSAVLEPLFNRSRLSVRELLLSLITVAGIVLIFHFDTRFQRGILLGVVSSLFASLFTIANRRTVVATGCRPASMLLYELVGGSMTLGVVLVLSFIGVGELLPSVLPAAGTPVAPSVGDLLWLLVLASACTIGLQLLQIQVLKRLSAFTVNLTYNLEPVYSIIIAFTVFGEAKEMSSSFFVGLMMIILSVVMQTICVIHDRSGEPVSHPTGQGKAA